MSAQRTILEISGSERISFLQNLITNDVSQSQRGLIYAALLTPQGKYLADFFVLVEPERVLLDVDSALSQSLAQRLTMYKLRADVTITESDVQVYCGTGDCPAGAVSDPRHPAQGWRLYGRKSGDDNSDWTAIRVAHAIPASGQELIPNDTFILEAGFERLNGVDFKKGCYVGQEVTARMKHKTELRKGFATVVLSQKVPEGTEISCDGKTVGTITSRANKEAIAYLRFDRIGSNMRAGEAEVVLKDANPFGE